MSNPTLPGIQRVRFEEVTPAHTIAAFFDGHLQSLITCLQLPIYDSYDDLDEIQFVFLTLPSGQTVTLGQYAGSPQIGVDLYIDLKLQDPAAVVFETCKYLCIPRQEVVWFHPDWQEEIDRLYAEHGEIEKRPELSQVNELAQSNQYEPIDCFNHALQIYTRQEFPEYWAMLQHNLGLAYKDRTQGDRLENLQRSIECFNKSLEVYTQKDFPEKSKMNWDDLRKSQELRKSILVEDILDRSIPNRLLSGEDLRSVYLISAYLRGANLSSADLSDANLSGANLSGVNLSGANVEKTQFQWNFCTKKVRFKI